MFPLMVNFIADTILHFQLCSASHTLSLFLSLRCLTLSPISIIWYKSPGIHFHLIIDRNELMRFTSLFHLEVAHNNLQFEPSASWRQWHTLAETFCMPPCRHFRKAIQGVMDVKLIFLCHWRRGRERFQPSWIFKGKARRVNIREIWKEYHFASVSAKRKFCNICYMCEC
jgi:hypothetical protein